MKRNVVIALVALLALLGLRFAFGPGEPPPDDVRQIEQLIETARLGAEEGEPNKITDAIADRASIQGMQTQDSQGWIRRSINAADDIHVTLTRPAIRVDGDQAVANIAKGDITFKLVGTSHETSVGDLQLKLRKNKVRKWIFFSEMRWQIVSAEAGSAPDIGVD